MELITDRTQRDVDYLAYLNRLWQGGVFAGTAAELAEWWANPKGAYNASDLNRVGAAVHLIADRLISAGNTITVNPKLDWKEADIPTPAQLDNYLSDVSAIRAALPCMASTPAVPGDMSGLTYREANNIEQILMDIHQLINNMALAWYYSGDLYSGEG